MRTSIWRFAESFPADRTQRLLKYTSFDEIASFMKAAKVIDFAWEPFQHKRLKGCNRASFLLQVSEQLYDAFFNSPVGYRSQYAVGISAGESANRKLLSKLEAKLLEFAKPLNLAPETRVQVQTSLCATDAKLWIYEPEVEGQLGEETPAIIYFPWQQSSTDGVGLLAPVGTKLEVKGGWLDSQGYEHRDPFKATRSEDIYRHGFS